MLSAQVVALAVSNGVPVPGMTASLAYFDTYRRSRLPANLVQACQPSPPLAAAGTGACLPAVQPAFCLCLPDQHCC